MVWNSRGPFNKGCAKPPMPQQTPTVATSPLGLMPAGDYHWTAAVKNVKGPRLPAGRALDAGRDTRDASVTPAPGSLYP